MSRAEFSNENYRLAFGVDHTPIGCFFQVWDKAATGENEECDETDGPHVEADEMFGYHVNNQNTVERNEKLREFISRKRSLRDPLTFTALGRILGFTPKELDSKVYELLS